MTNATARALGLFSAVAISGVFLPACATQPSTGAPCTSSADCTGGRMCIDNVCVTVRDGGGGDAGTGGGTDTGTGGSGDAGGLVDTSLNDVGMPMGGDTGPILMDMDASGFGTTDDSDGDGISDFHEGRATLDDTDGDGTPDYLDTESDLDGIPDSVEAGDMDVRTPPIDTDGDGTPDYHDVDSDENGIRDMIEGAADTDTDGRPDFRDFDNDDDGVRDLTEIEGRPTSPPDTDGNGTPNYDQYDSDADTISDFDEDVIDTDADTLVDMVDLDSDGDGWTDGVEAGDADVHTPPIDTDGDSIADFRDPDSDADGLSDSAERTAGTSPILADTDSDGVTDLVEVGAGTDPLLASDNPRARGDFVFVVPYMMPPSPVRDTLQFSTTLQRADVYFLMDNTGSMGGTVAALQSGLTTGTLVAGCPGGVIGAIRCGIPEAWFGVGGFDDYPAGGYGVGSYSTDAVGIIHDQAFFQYSIMTMSTATASAAVGRYRVNNGNDVPESGLAALYALASRDTLGGYVRYATGTTVTTTPPACAAGYRGAACFRPDAVPIIIIMSDVDQHNSPTCGCNYSGVSAPAYATVTASLATLNARVVGIDTGSSTTFMTRLISDTTIARGAPGTAGDYLIRAPGGSGLTSSIVTLVQRASQVPLDVSASAVDLVDAGETIDAVASFLDHLETNPGPAAGHTCTSGFMVTDRAGIDGDTYPDTFQRVTPGSPVCFDVIPKQNDVVMPTLVPQLFRAQINVVGDGFTPLDHRVIYFLVPPRIPDPNGG